MVHIIKLVDEIAKLQWVNLKKSKEIIKCVRVDIYFHGSNWGCVSQFAWTCPISLHPHIYGLEIGQHFQKP
jgi:hypothetical protein